MKISNILRRLDAYPRLAEDFSVRTLSGATVTVISTAVIIILVTCEFYAYLTPNITEELFVDTSRGHKLRINVDITLATLACNYLSLDAMDSSGDQHLQIEHNVFKTRLDLHGNPIQEKPIKEIISVVKSNETCGSCYGAQQNNTHCCNSCEDVIEAYKIMKWGIQPEKIEQCKDNLDKYKRSDSDAFKEGCRIAGHIEVNRMAGSFHIAPGASFSINQFHIHDFSFAEFKLTHTINHLSFGEKIEFAHTHPMDGLHVEANTESKSQMYNYYLKIIPTMYMKKNTTPIHTNQFSVTQYKKELTGRGERGMPGLFFSYELSPLMVKYTEKERSLGHFATNICSIVGGVFTAAGIIVSLLQNSMKIIQEKLELGKLS